MKPFQTIDAVEAWLEPMNYEEFWLAIRPYCLVINPRAQCDADIEAGYVAQDDVLQSLKMIATHELTKRHGLERKPSGPVLRSIAGGRR